MKGLLVGGFARLGLTPPDQAAEQMEKYAGLLLEQNKVMNLTAITDPNHVATLHFLDSAALLTAADFEGKRVIDVGTGAGFPGLVLKLLEPSLSLTLLDSLGKRVEWLKSVCDQLGIADVRCVHARAEEAAHDTDYREKYDFAVSRAVAPMRLLAELCLPFIRPGGRLLAMKTTGSGQEISEAQNALRLLGGDLLPAFDYTVPHTDIRHRLVAVEKSAPTPKRYPRRWAKMQKSPL